MTATEEQRAAGEINRLLVRLTRFLLRNSAEGGFEVRDTVRRVAGACGAKADVLAIAEGAVLTVRHPDDSSYAETVQVTPELARLDLVQRASSWSAGSSTASSGRGRRTRR